MTSQQKYDRIMKLNSIVNDKTEDLQDNISLLTIRINGLRKEIEFMVESENNEIEMLMEELKKEAMEKKESIKFDLISFNYAIRRTIDYDFVANFFSKIPELELGVRLLPYITVRKK